MSDNGVSNWIDKFYELNPSAIVVDEIKQKKDNLLPLAEEFAAMDFKDTDFYNRLTEEQKKVLSPWVLMRWMSSSRSDTIYHLTMVNDIVNNNFSVISKHPELQWKLLAVCGTNKKQYRDWIPPGKKSKKNKLEEILIKFYPLMKDDELELFKKINTKESFEQLLKDNGIDDKIIKEIFKNDTKGK